MKKIMYILSFMLDIILLPFIILLVCIGTIILYIIGRIRKENELMKWTFKDYILQAVEFIKCKFSQGMQIHKHRILGV